MKKIYLLKPIGYGFDVVDDKIFTSEEDAKEWLQVNNSTFKYDIIERVCYDSIDEAYEEEPQVAISQLTWRKNQLEKLTDLGEYRLPLSYNKMLSKDKDKLEDLRNFISQGIEHFKNNTNPFFCRQSDFSKVELKNIAKYYRQLCLEINNINSRLEKIFISSNLDKRKYNITDDQLKPLQHDEFDDFIDEKPKQNENQTRYHSDNYIDLE